MAPRTLSGILWNLLILWLIISKSISLFFDIDGSMFIIWKILSNVLIISICLLLFRGPSIRELEMSIGKEIAGKLKLLFTQDKEKVEKWAKILYAQARLINGLDIDNPLEISALICELM